MNISAFPFGWQNLCQMKINIKLLPNDHNAAMKRVFSCGPQYMALFHSVFGGVFLRIKSYKNIIMNFYRIHVEYCIFSLNSPPLPRFLYQITKIKIGVCIYKNIKVQFLYKWPFNLFIVHRYFFLARLIVMICSWWHCFNRKKNPYSMLNAFFYFD